MVLKIIFLPVLDPLGTSPPWTTSQSIFDHLVYFLDIDSVINSKALCKKLSGKYLNFSRTITNDVDQPR